ncbi:hypothetical protein HAX54_011861 [Datura stramonium]|uniref:NB-ARC domain-containing protein n=1 Tax=Datura stramonium TaxID=4076 RepID=A0ABS8TKJ0_DATST|nr:hypothetical protein [Datura stramonium]
MSFNGGGPSNNPSQFLKDSDTLLSILTIPLKLSIEIWKLHLVQAGYSAIGAFLQVLFDRMATREFLNLFRGRKHDTKILKKLQTTLKTLDVVYHADDLLDEVNTEALRIKVEGETEEEEGGHTSQKGHQVSDCISSLSAKFLDEIMPKIKETVEELECFVQQIDLLGLQKGSIINAKKVSLRLPSTSLVSESIIVGRDSEIEKIINLLLSEDANNKEFSVIPVVGLGGIGKTTLAQVVFNDERVKYHFNLRAWVCVSENYDILRITKSLLEEVGSSGVGISDNFNMLQTKLKEHLKNKKVPHNLG